MNEIPQMHALLVAYLDQPRPAKQQHLVLKNCFLISCRLAEMYQADALSAEPAATETNEINPAS